MILVGLGSNLGDRETQLQQALQRLEEKLDLRVAAVSNIYETKPVGDMEQPDFLNMVALLETELTPFALLQQCLAVETDMGRVRTRRWGPRVIDIDLLVYHENEMNTPCLTLPHPEIVNRGFVLIPLNDVAPALLLAGTRSVATMAAAYLASDPESVRLWKKISWDSDKRSFIA